MKNHTKPLVLWAVFTAVVFSAVFLFVGNADAQNPITSPREACQFYQNTFEKGLISVVRDTEDECLVRVGDTNIGFGYTRYYYSDNKLCVENSGEYYNLASPQTECTNISKSTPAPTTDDTCPGGLQVCGNSCIPTNAECCETGSYCVKPGGSCADQSSDSCHSCPTGQKFCGMFCYDQSKECTIADSQKTKTPTPAPTPKVKATEAEDRAADGNNGIGGIIDFSRGTVDLIRSGVTFPVTPNFEGSVGGGDAIRIGEGGIVSIISTGGAIQFGENTFAEFVGLEFDPPRIVTPDIPEGILDPSYKYEPDDWEFWTHLMEDIVSFNAQNPPKFLLSCLKAEIDSKSCGEDVATFLHDGVGWFQDKMEEDFPPKLVVTPRTAITTNGTEFIVEVAKDGATTVTTLDGSVIVTDLISRKSVEVGVNYKITVPKSVEGLSEQELKKNLTSVDPGSINRWWEEKTQEQSDEEFRHVMIGAFALFLVVMMISIVFLKIKKIIKNRKSKPDQS